MIRNISKLLANSALLSLFLMMLVLPVAFLGFANYEEDSAVLSAQDSKESNAPKNLQKIRGDVPVEIEDMIIKLENDYYQNAVQKDDEMVNGSEPSLEITPNE